MKILLIELFKWIGTSVEEDGLGSKISSRKASMMYLHLLLTFMVVTTGAANNWNYPDEIWYLISIGSMGYSAMRVWDKRLSSKQVKKTTVKTTSVKKDEAI